MFLLALTRPNGRDKTVPTRKSSELTGNRQEQGLGHQMRVTEGVMETLDKCGGLVGVL